MNHKHLDKQISHAFEDLIQEVTSSTLLGRIARQPKRLQEDTVSDYFRDALVEQFEGRAGVIPEESRNYAYGKTYIHDIVVRFDAGEEVVIEVKTPFTNHDGIRSKTRKPEQLPKDVSALHAALKDGVTAVYSLVAPIGCYPVDTNGEMIVLNRSSVLKNERVVKERFRIQWPTRMDYNGNGKSEVDRAMSQLADDRILRSKRIKGWTHIDLPKPRRDLHSFIDCALYKIWQPMR